MTRRSLMAPIVLLLPSLARAQSTADDQAPLLWLWLLLGIALLALMVVLLFRAGPRQRARARAVSRSRRGVERSH